MRLLLGCVVSLALLRSGAAEAACVISDVQPTGVLPDMARPAVTLSFVATHDCATVGFATFRPSVFTKVPTPAGMVGPGQRRYKVVIPPEEWSSLTPPRVETFVWTVTGTTVGGTVTHVTTTNEIDSDHDGWTRTDGDVLECDFMPGRNPGLVDVMGNGVDDDCDGVVDNTRFEDPVAVISTAEHDTMLGRTDCLSAGDVDGDGIDDLQLATWVNTSAGGAVYIVPGPTSGDIDVADVVTISAPVGHVGYGVTAGDVDADGIDDVLSGSYWASRWGYLFLGPVTTDRDLADADAVLTGSEGSRIDLDVVPDFDGDAAPDVVVGAQYVGDYAGAAYVLSGPVSGDVAVHTDAAYAYLGEAGEFFELGTVDLDLGDATGDGIHDLALAAPVPGVVHLVEGGGTPGAYDAATVAWATLTAAEVPGQFGTSLAGGDYDGDGATDIFVGHPDAGGDHSGIVYAFLGPLSGATDTTAAEVSWASTEGWIDLGAALSMTDIDADGAPDIFLGAPSAIEGAGAVYVQTGPASGTVDVSTLPLFQGVVSPDYFGSSIAAIADWTGDGGSEIAIGAPRVGVDLTTYQGAVSVFESRPF